MATTTTTATTTRDLRAGDRFSIGDGAITYTVVDTPQLITTGWHAGRDQYRGPVRGP